MPEDEPNAIGLGVPPPVIYLGPLLLGLLLDRRIPVPFLPRRSTRIVGLPLIGGGVLLGGWTFRTMRRADTPVIGEPFVPDKPTTTLITDGHSATPATQDTSEQRWFMQESQASRMCYGSSFSC